MRTVGLVGLGLLGTAIAGRLRAHGMHVVGCDLIEAKRQDFSAAGGEAVQSAAEVFRRADQIVLSLPDSRAVAGLIESVGAELRAGMLVVDTSTGDPADAEKLGAELAMRGVAYLEATVAGSSAVVRDGAAVVMTGGTDADAAAARPILDAFATQVFHIGGWGSGGRMKLVVNLVLGLNRAALAEGLTLARALELDPATTLAVLQAGAAYSRTMDAKGPKMLAGDFAPQARLSQHLKDVRLMLAAAAQAGIELPLSQVHRQLLERAEALGLGESDNSAILRAFER